MCCVLNSGRAHKASEHQTPHTGSDAMCGQTHSIIAHSLVKTEDECQRPHSHTLLCP